MRYEIRQTATGWELVNLSTGAVVAATSLGGTGTSPDAQHAGYAEMARQLGDRMAGELAAGDGTDGGDTGGSVDGLLPDVWESDAGIAFSELLAGGRDFTQCAWTWRDPTSGPIVPLMLQTENDYAHLGAVLAGFVESFTLTDGTVSAVGRFFDTDTGRAFRDLLLGGRTFGVSVDPTERIDIQYECDAMDDYGWCEEERAVFLAYEIGGLTGCPFPGFENAGIRLQGAAPVNAGGGTVRESIGAALNAAGRAPIAPVRPPRSWFFVDPPVADDDPRLVLQPADETGVERLAIPLTITADGQVFGNMAAAGVCHVGYAGQCVEVPTSPTGYARFHLGATPCDDGTTVPTGVLVAGADHAPLTLNGDQLRSRHEATSLQWADVRATDTPYGPFVCGALRPDVTEELVRALSGSAVSGEWRDEGRGLDLILAVSVSSPGWPIFREPVGLVASALGGRTVTLPAARTRVRYRDGRPIALSAGLPVAQPGHRGCRSCGDGPVSTSRRPHNTPSAEISTLTELVRLVEQRTRHLTGPAVDAALARIVGRS